MTPFIKNTRLCAVMDDETNKKLLNEDLCDRYLISLLNYKEAAKITLPHIRSSFFSSGIKREVFSAVKFYFKEYDDIPTRDILEFIIKNKGSKNTINSSLRYINKLYNMSVPAYEWVIKNINNHVQKIKIRNAMFEAEDLVDDDIEKAKRKIVDFIKDPGLGLVEHKNQLTLTKDEVYSIMSNVDNFCCPTGITALDNEIKGLFRQELFIIMSVANIGKSWAAVHLTISGLIHGKSVLFFTVEMSYAMIMQRILQSISSTLIPKHGEFEREVDLWDEKYENKVKEVKETTKSTDKIVRHLLSLKRFGGILEIPTLDIKHRPTVEYIIQSIIVHEVKHGKHPDLIVIDGLTDVKHSGSDDPNKKRLGLNSLVQDLRTVAQEYNCSIVITHQANREGVSSKKLTIAHSGESFGIMQIADTAISLEQKDKEYEDNTININVIRARHRAKFIKVKCYQNIAMGQFHLHSEKIKKEQKSR